mmetsp:Transcript_29328/g.61828  ORF Transcript_29328/g.61828 Transcript_29328/m.61828 type:complete len:804 (+) Transcript_29328:229-2640(+)|eukprot:CAMPEP_0183711204 /NCGR_PEP_ID=MMETSP0737-20130205/6765_1 /TAXON_ID=385413 /ORGANISM="Thalassiosira miniscula, Strain CCMP1093" /LENGTH=803 /DNA_ID=CAMNT_0025939657 /DNA_START=117 /DNA_END=2528 /DNA_ORIENTATION=-
MNQDLNEEDAAPQSNSVPSSPNNVTVDEDDETGVMRSFRFAPSIAPPRTDRHTILDVIAVSDPQDEMKERDRMIKKEIEEHPRKDPPDGAESISNTDPSIRESRNDTNIGAASSESSTDDYQGGEQPIELNASSPTVDNYESRNNNSTIVYNGSNARCEVTSPISISETTDYPREDTLPTFGNSDQPVEIPEAYLVESRGLFSFITGSRAPIAVHAEPLQPWYKRPWGRIMILVVVVLVLAFLVFVGFYVVEKKKDENKTESPSFLPSIAPSFDSRPTLEIVRSRGEIRCGVPFSGSGEGFFVQMCRALASVIFGDPERVKLILVTSENDFVQLQNRIVDALVSGDMHTIRREVNEMKTQSGFYFSFPPYFFTGIVYFGQREYVICAEEQIRYGYCENLVVCIPHSEIVLSKISLYFPISRLRTGSSLNDMIEKLFDGTCNVMAHDFFQFFEHPKTKDGFESGKYVFSNTTLSYEPLAMVTRNVDQEWSDICEGTLQGLIKGWQENITQDTSLCPVRASNSLNISFMNAPICVGNYGDIVNKYFDGEVNKVGLISAPAFGNLECSMCNNANALKQGTLEMIVSRKKLNCGVVAQYLNAENNMSSEYSEGLSRMNEIFCHAVAAAIFQDDESAVNISYLGAFNNSLFLADTYDVIAGGWRNLSDWSPELSDMVFSIPYYYAGMGDGDDRIISFATQKGDPLFSSFVNAVVTATIYAVRNGITGEINSVRMPLIDTFGNDLQWMLRDVIASSGNYDEIFYQSYGIDVDRGFNRVIVGGSRPQALGVYICTMSGVCIPGGQKEPEK